MFFSNFRVIQLFTPATAPLSQLQEEPLSPILEKNKKKILTISVVTVCLIRWNASSLIIGKIILQLLNIALIFFFSFLTVA